ncbi:MAG: flagellar export protein FliJ [Spirochaetae bacterium HGW-Spirochaetae-1]|jgi:flagellar FliJ protein|nr:MAG: flagellar export protein FliJ [Spirochaetae bacterium HGW-Spirochaetae-1]
MKKFEFKLQRLLDLREARERGVQNELAILVSEQNRERLKQDDLRRNITEFGKSLREKMRKGEVVSGEAMQYGKFVSLATMAIDSAENRIQGMEPGISEVRGRLIEASKERKVVEKLREKKLEEYRYELDRETAKENDDMNQKIYLRRMVQAAFEGGGG